MTLERKDVRVKMDHDYHAAAKAIAEAEGYGDEVAAWAEQVLVGIIKKRVHSATLVVDQLKASGAIGTFKDVPGSK